ncbi:MAG: hypothetical protein V4710_13440, partial [Verrucomicrobiota bacterium]
AHVAKLLFQHEQTSHLTVTSEGLPVGHLRIEPTIEEKTAQRHLAFRGNLSVQLPQAVRQRFHGNGILKMDQAMDFEHLTLEFIIKDPVYYRVEIQIEKGENLVHFTTQESQEGAPETRAYTLDEAGASSMIKDLGIDPTMARAVGSTNSIRPEISARQSSLQIHGERADTYLITVTQSGQTLLDAHVSQIGQLLSIKTFLGYTLAPEDLTP